MPTLKVSTTSIALLSATDRIDDDGDFTMEAAASATVALVKALSAEAERLNMKPRWQTLEMKNYYDTNYLSDMLRVEVEAVKRDGR